tara:strand:- start:6967 stop:7221 length:255 start_codon:yes stop_codon:yes gene_type:complete
MELIVSSGESEIKGNFCVTQISNSDPITEVVVDMGKDVYRSTKANIERFYSSDKELFSFFSGIFCEKIRVSALDSHVIVVYEDA